MTIKCCKNFQSQYVYINNRCIHINDFILKFKNNKDISCLCYHGHKIHYIKQSFYKKSHFKHSNDDDIDQESKMSEWHSEWQGNFEITEYILKKLPEQYKERHIDAFLYNEKIAIEFQHSPITKQEVDERKYDYQLHNVSIIIWIIDGYNIELIIKDKRIILKFKDEWNYKSFMSYNYIFIDINNNLYKIYPRKIINNTIDVNFPLSKEEFIKILKNNNNELNNIPEPMQCKLTIQQMGAGNGKTFGIINKLQEDTFSGYNFIILVTKQHSAKEVIKSEWTKQLQNDNLSNIDIINSDDSNRKYIYTYINNKTKKKCILVISTIDSLILKLCDKDNNGCDKFKSAIESIIDGNIKSCIKYPSTITKTLNKQTCIIIDETQDLPEYYGKALLKIMTYKYVDGYVVGDLLQSISYEENAFAYLHKTIEPYIEYNILEKKNICRRFYYKSLVEFCNSMIQFKNFYDLKEITPSILNQDNEECLQLVPLHEIKEESDNIFKNIDIILKNYIYEVEKNNRKPEDFLIVTPFTKNNIIIEYLEEAINKYWNKQNNNEKYFRYAYFHKSEIGNSINTSISNNKTRIVSIHSSKGDGRKVVFVIGCDEHSLKKFNQGKKNLIYESLLHVAITRMEEKLYFYYKTNNDDIHKRITKYYKLCNKNSDAIPSISLTNTIKFTDILNYCINDNILSLLQKYIIYNENCSFDDCIFNTNTQLVDMQHHNIRYFCMYITFWLKTIKLQDQDSNQLKHILEKIKYANISKEYCWKEYRKSLIYNKELNMNRNKNNSEIYRRKILVLSYSDNSSSKYSQYEKIILEFMKSLQQKKIDNILNLKKVNLCSYETIILYYMFNACEYGFRHHDLTITELYEITHIYYTEFNHNINGHKKCLCCERFPNNDNTNNSNNTMYNCLFSHYDKIKLVGKQYIKFLKNTPKLNILIDKYILMNDNANNFKISNCYTIGYNNDIVYIIYLRPTFNTMNRNTYLIESILDTWFILNRKEDYEEDNRIRNKLINVVLFSLDDKKYYIFNWNNDLMKNCSFIFKNILKKYILDLHSSELDNYYQYLKIKYENHENDDYELKLHEIKQAYEKIFKSSYNMSGSSCCKYFTDYIDHIREQEQYIAEQNIYNYDIFKIELVKKINSSIKSFLNITLQDEKKYINTFN